MTEPSSNLPVVNSPIADTVDSPSTLRSVLVHVVRVCLIVAIVLLARQKHQKFLEQRRLTPPPLNTATIQELFPTVETVRQDPARHEHTIHDGQQNQIGMAVQTSPISDPIVGYAGSTNVLILFDASEQIAGLKILDSFDTHEHVDMIRNDPSFLSAMNGKTWRQAAVEPLDAVTGATLTSLAIEESIHRRLGNAQPSLRFPDAVETNDIARWLPRATKIVPEEQTPGWFQLADNDGHTVGLMLRTTPAADAVIGYQGPCDVLVLFDAEGKALRSVLRSSYDNNQPAPFVRYVQEDKKFNRLVAGLTLEQIATLDPESMDGVSGATMTSFGMLESMQHAAEQAIKVTTPTRSASWQPAWRDAGTLLVLLFAMLLCFSKLNTLTWLRRAFQVVLVVYFGFLNGDLLSQTLFAGWGRSGIPWRHASGLALLTIASLVVPIIAKRNLYCHHICPFGAAQQLLRTRIKNPVSVPRRLANWLERIPALLLLVVFVSLFFNLSINLAAIEPFDAFSIRAAGVATIAIACVGLIASAFVPMAYCKFGCPTGALLEYIRRTRRSDRLDLRDGLAVTLLVAAIFIGVS